MSSPPTTPHTTGADTHGDAHAAPHHGSWAPIIIAASVAFLYMGLKWPMMMLPIGLVIGGIGLTWWIREDVVRFRAIAHQHQPHVGYPGPVWGVILFIATEVMIFASLFAVWFVGKSQALAKGEWRPGDLHLPIESTGLNTIILIASGATLHWGYMRLKKSDQCGYLIGLALTIILGAVFLFNQVREYGELIHEGLTFQGYKGLPDLYGSTFYMLTGTHGFHVAGGLLYLIIVFLRSMTGGQTKENHVALETASLYWHFVDVVWIFLYVVVYLEWL